MAEKCKLRTSIEDFVKQGRSNDAAMIQALYSFYFNYNLNTTTWRLVVNKQILMNYHRLLIECQLNEVKKREKKLKFELEGLEN